jgi:cytochrome c biogenesis protein
LRSLFRLLSSVRFAILLFILVTASSILGTFFPGLNLYRTPWYLSLLLVFALNILVCTLTRLRPRLRRALKPAWDWTAAGLAAEPESRTFRSEAGLEGQVRYLCDALAARRYRTRQSGRDGAVLLLGRKRTLGGFGADIVHIGLLVILAGGILSGLFSRRADLFLSRGQTVDVPFAGFQVRLEDFQTEYYPNGEVKDWKSRLTVLEERSPILTQTIEVNHPLKYRGVNLFQSSYGWNWDEASVVLRVRKNGDPAFEREIKVRVGGETDLPGTDLRIAVVRFVPDFVIGSQNEIQTRSYEPNNPAVLIEGRRSGRTVLSGWLFNKYPEFSRVRDAEAAGLAFELRDIKADQFSVLQAASDPGLVPIWLGCVAVMAGLFLAFYWTPREIRAVLEVKKGKVDTVLAGYAAKAAEAFQAEIEAVVSAARRERS